MRNGRNILKNGTIEYYKNNELHREDGPAIICGDRTKVWYVGGKQHRLDGPAYEGANGNKVWCIEGKFHREDGPAVEFANGNKEWWLYGIKYSIREWIINHPTMTDDEKILFKLSYGGSL